MGIYNHTDRHSTRRHTAKQPQTYHCNESTNENVVVEIVWYLDWTRADLQRIWVTGVFEKLVLGIHDFLGQQIEPLPVDHNQPIKCELRTSKGVWSDNQITKHRMYAECVILSKHENYCLAHTWSVLQYLAPFHRQSWLAIAPLCEHTWWWAIGDMPSFDWSSECLRTSAQKVIRKKSNDKNSNQKTKTKTTAPRLQQQHWIEQ